MSYLDQLGTPKCRDIGAKNTVNIYVLTYTSNYNKVYKGGKEIYD